MLNFRKLKQDFSSNILTKGKELFDQNKVIHVKILRLDSDLIRFSGKVGGKFENSYENEVEIDRFESEMIHSNCDCTYRYDCVHLAAMIYYLEEHIDSILVDYSKEAEIESDEDLDTEEKEELLQTIKEAECKRVEKLDANYQKQVLEEYITAANLLSSSSFFLPLEEEKLSKAEIAFIFNPKSLELNNKNIEFQLALRLPSRSKPLQVPNIREFLNAVRYKEPIYIASKKYYFTADSFDEIGKCLISYLLNTSKFQEKLKNERGERIALIHKENLGLLLADLFTLATKNMPRSLSVSEELPSFSSVFIGTLENPLCYSFSSAYLRFDLEYIQPPAKKILLDPKVIADQNIIRIDDAYLFESSRSGMIYDKVYYRFPEHIKRHHLQNLFNIRDLTIPEPLFGTFVENSLPELKRFAEVFNLSVIEQFVTLPFVGELEAKCVLSYLDGVLEADLRFFYDGKEINSSFNTIGYTDIASFVKEEGIVARNLVEEHKIIEDLFQDFIYNEESGTYIAKSEKKIVEFMTEVVPRNQEKVNFECPQNLLDLFIYDKTEYKLHLDYEDNVGYYTVYLDVQGELKGIKLDILWECMASKRTFIELGKKSKDPKKKKEIQLSKILVLDLDKISKIVQIFDEMGIQKLDTRKESRPLFSLVNIEESLFVGLPITFTMTDKLKEIKKQMLGEKEFNPSAIPALNDAELREYQKSGVYWLERLRSMFLNGILADDMGLGKTIQAIASVTQYHKKHKKSKSIVICPTSLLYNWKEEIYKFNPELKVNIIDGPPSHRKKAIEEIDQYDVIITTYTLMQKDVEVYKDIHFAYIILDEAQHIKNRSTRNAKSVKILRSTYRLILTGTPIENSLDELWSLFDFLMPGFLSSYDRFSEKYLRKSGEQHLKNMKYLKKKVSPFILRRMKEDVLNDLPPVSEIVYHCQLADSQFDLYRSYAESAKEELVKLVERDGFEKVQIHVLATLTRLKQICCHPAIFAKEKPEIGDSAKYEMLLELLQTLIDGGHKTVIFSQYTKMLQIMSKDFQKRGISFSYLDGGTKNRLEIVKEFNEDPSIGVFLVSLKAGGTGLNITGADTVIHYDMWWNPAVENQATDRVHRIGQKKAVSSYKLITHGTIEEKIVEMQKRKKGLVKKIVSCDDEALSKLTWQDVLELLQT